MSQFILDEQLDLRQLLTPLQALATTRSLQGLRPAEHILDDRVPDILRTLRQPTFLTIDTGFWDRELCHSGYCILYFHLRRDQQYQIPDLLRALLRRPEFRTRTLRMGKVARVSNVAIDYWEFQVQDLQHIDWQPTARKKR